MKKRQEIYKEKKQRLKHQKLLRNYPYLITGEEAKKTAEAVPMGNREYWMVTVSEGVSMAFFARASSSTTFGLIVDPKSGKKYLVQTVGVGVGLGSPSAGYGTSIGLNPFITSPDQLGGWSGAVGGKILNILDLEAQFGTSKEDLGASIGVDINKKLSGDAKLGNFLADLYPKTGSFLRTEAYVESQSEWKIFVLDITLDKNLSKTMTSDQGINYKNIEAAIEYMKTNPSNIGILAKPKILDFVNKKREIGTFE